VLGRYEDEEARTHLANLRCRLRAEMPFLGYRQHHPIDVPTIVSTGHQRFRVSTAAPSMYGPSGELDASCARRLLSGAPQHYIGFRCARTPVIVL